MLKRKVPDNGAEETKAQKRARLLELRKSPGEVAKLFATKGFDGAKHTGIIVDILRNGDGSTRFWPSQYGGFNSYRMTVVFLETSSGNGDTINVPFGISGPKREKAVQKWKTIPEMGNFQIKRGDALSIFSEYTAPGRTPLVGDIVDIFNLKYGVETAKKVRQTKGKGGKPGELLVDIGDPQMTFSSKFNLVNPEMSFEEKVGYVAKAEFDKEDRYVHFEKYSILASEWRQKHAAPALGVAGTFNAGQDAPAAPAPVKEEVNPFEQSLDLLFALTYPSTYGVFLVDNSEEPQKAAMDVIQGVAMEDEEGFYKEDPNYGKVARLNSGVRGFKANSIDPNAESFIDVEMNCFEGCLKEFGIVDVAKWVKFGPTIIRGLRALACIRVDLPRSLSQTSNEKETFDLSLIGITNLVIDWRTTLKNIGIKVSQEYAVKTVYKEINEGEVDENLAYTGMLIDSDYQPSNSLCSRVLQMDERSGVDAFCMNEGRYSASKYPAKKWNCYALLDLEKGKQAMANNATEKELGVLEADKYFFAVRV